LAAWIANPALPVDCERRFNYTRALDLLTYGRPHSSIRSDVRVPILRVPQHLPVFSAVGERGNHLANHVIEIAQRH
jgi:hypothetical protein